MRRSFATDPGARAAASMSVALASALALYACGEEQRLPGVPDGPGRDGGSGEGGGLLATSSAGGPPPVDAAGLCGNQLHETIAAQPNLYFVFDGSGSMREPAGAGSRYDAVRVAAIDLLRKLGPLVRAGAAIFPGAAHDCAAGEQVFPVTAGDPKSTIDGPMIEGFRVSTYREPKGGTPTAATLAGLHDPIAALPGKTIVVLATDGGPNCNFDASCGVDECMPNIEGGCPQTQNCCAEGGPGGPSLCVDRAASVDAIAAHATAGVDVYVVGVPGSAAYGPVLDEMAVAGHTARDEAPRYYRVDDFAALTGVFGSIASVVVSCKFELEDPPETEEMTNVYIDGQVLPNDPESGWAWASGGAIELVGETCDRLKRGEIASVQIVSGCPTETPK